MRYFLKRIVKMVLPNHSRYWQMKTKALNIASSVMSVIPGYYSSDEPDSFRYKLALTAIIKNEGRYLTEWIDYHLLVGIEHFYLYNNGSTDNTSEVLKPYVERGIVDLINFPGQAKQIPAYHDSLRRHRNECRYMAVIDADEFIRPVEDGRSIYDLVEEIIASANDRKVVGIKIPWRTFGSSGLSKKPSWGGGN